MTPEERIAEVLRAHQWLDFYVAREAAYNRGEDGPEDHCRCGWHIEDEDAFDHEDHLAAAVVAAVRSWPPEAAAELIGGEVRRRNVSLGVVDRPGQPTGIRIRPEARVVGPWTSDQQTPLR